MATDRISAYDVIMKNGVPQKGALLTLMTTHWFNLFKEKIPDLKTHLISAEVPESVAKSLPAEVAEQLRLRTMHVRRLKVLPLESIVRGYITGSAWSEYKKSGTVHGIAMPKGLQESQKLETPLWTPSTKAEVGDKDENISPEEATKIVGEKYAKKIEELSLKVYQIVSFSWEWLVMVFELISVHCRLEIMLLSVVSLLLIPSLSLVLMSILMRLFLWMRSLPLIARASGLQTSTRLESHRTASTRYLLTFNAQDSRSLTI